MKIAFDESPIVDKNSLHQFRGGGFYIQQLKTAFQKYFPENDYYFFHKNQLIPRNSDVIHYPYFEPFFKNYSTKDAKRIVITIHDLIPLLFPHYFPAGIRGKIQWFLQRYRLKDVHIITDSISSKNDIQKLLKKHPDEISMIYLAASPVFIQKKISKQQMSYLTAKYRLPEKFVLYVGDVTSNKNLPTLVRAIKKIQIPLVMVGKALTNTNYDRKNPWNKDLVITQEEIKGVPYIKCLGFVPDEDLVLLYNMATLFIMPSLYEGFGLPVIEAMSCGCPVITSRGGSLPEVAGDAAFYVDPYNETDVANAIQKVFMSNQLQKQLSSKGLIQARRFSWEKTAKETLEVYKKILLKS